VPPPPASSRVSRVLAGLRHALTEADYGSALNSYLPWRSAFGSLCLVAAAAVLCGLFLHSHAWVLAFSVLGAMLLGLVWPWVSVLGLRGRLTLERRRAREGERVAVRLELTNWLPLGAWGLRIQGDFGQGCTAALSLAVVPAWRTTTFTWDFVPACRGEYPRGGVRLTTGFPFGLWEAGRSMDVAGRVLVWPRTFPVGPMPEAAASGRSRDGVVLQNKAGDSGDLLGLRPYRHGDSLRRVHWIQTARQGALIVREQQASAFPRVQVILDAEPCSHAGAGPDGSLEWAVRIAASLARDALRQQAVVGFVAADRVVSPDGGPAQEREILGVLARLESARSSGLAALLRSAGGGVDDGLQVVVTTDRGLSRLPGELVRRPGRRFVCLCAAAFDNGDAPPTPPFACRIDDPARVPEQLAAVWREVADAS
jgi:uncharacterized protein (DUF58 family)